MKTTYEMIDDSYMRTSGSASWFAPGKAANPGAAQLQQDGGEASTITCYLFGIRQDPCA